MDPNNQASNPREDTAEPPLDARLDQFLDQKAKSTNGGERQGTYVLNLERVVPKWISWSANRGIETFAGLDEKHMASYAEHLDRRVRARKAGDENESGVTEATAWKYYNLVSAYLTYCRKWGEIDDNPAQAGLPLESMPDRPNSSSKDQQFWQPGQRQRLVAYVDERAADAIDERGTEAVAEVRDRAFVALIGYSAVRGAEVLRVPRGDDKRPGRQGATWGDLNLEDKTIDVLGKNQEHEPAPLTDKPVAALERWRTSSIQRPTTGRCSRPPTARLSGQRCTTSSVSTATTTSSASSIPTTIRWTPTASTTVYRQH